MTKAINSFINKESFSGIFLFISTVLALMIANSPLGEAYYNLWHTPLGITFGTTTVSMTLTYWIDDGLMALFFLLVGLEIKRELLYGELSSVQKASLPILGALGGMIVPALLYFVFNQSGEESNGFGIPMATDIAFALGIIMMLGKRVSVQLKVFLVSLAVVDDLGAVMVIAIFYSGGIKFTYLILAGVVMLALFILNRLRVKSVLPYLLLGIPLWIFIHDAGIHATIAGVILALFIPIKSKINDMSFIEDTRKALEEFDKNQNDIPLLSHPQQEALEIIGDGYHKVQSPLSKLEHNLHSFSAYFIMPLFAFSNAGIVIDLNQLEYTNIMIGVIMGLVVGKPLGIMLFTYVGIRLNIAKLPSGVDMRSIFGVSLLAGIGFTMSIFVAHLAFNDQAMTDSAKLAILVSSFIAGVLGVLTLLSRK